MLEHKENNHTIIEGTLNMSTSNIRDGYNNCSN